MFCDKERYGTRQFNTFFLTRIEDANPQKHYPIVERSWNLCARFQSLFDLCVLLFLLIVVLLSYKLHL